MQLIVDSHCHVSSVWYEPIETLLAQMGRNGVQQAVPVQLLGAGKSGWPKSQELYGARQRFGAPVAPVS